MNLKGIVYLVLAIPATLFALLMWLAVAAFMLDSSDTSPANGEAGALALVAALCSIPALLFIRAAVRASRSSTDGISRTSSGQLIMDVDTNSGLSAKLKSKQARILGATIDQIVQSHSATLATKRLQKQYSDDYGRLITEKWMKEKSYFIDNILTPALLGRFRRSKLHRFAASLATDVSKWPGCKHVRGNAGEAIHLYSLASIEFHVEMHGEAQAPTRRDPLDFERECAAELVRAGWDARVMGGSGDQGVDIVARHGSITCAFQCKLYSSSLGNTPVQEVHTGAKFHNADLAVVVTNSQYTDGARAAAQLVGVSLLHESELSSFTPALAQRILDSRRSGDMN